MYNKYTKISTKASKYNTTKEVIKLQESKRKKKEKKIIDKVATSAHLSIITLNVSV